jgi:hypothetical protein
MMTMVAEAASHSHSMAKCCHSTAFNSLATADLKSNFVNKSREREEARDTGRELQNRLQVYCNRPSRSKTNQVNSYPTAAPTQHSGETYGCGYGYNAFNANRYP